MEEIPMAVVSGRACSVTSFRVQEVDNAVNRPSKDVN